MYHKRYNLYSTHVVTSLTEKKSVEHINMRSSSKALIKTELLCENNFSMYWRFELQNISNF